MRDFFITFFLFFIFTSQLNAALIMGGYYSCGNYIKEGIEGNDKTLVVFNTRWTKGYISGRNAENNSLKGNII